MHGFNSRLKVVALVGAVIAVAAVSLSAASSNNVLGVANAKATGTATCKQGGSLKYGLAGGGVTSLDPSVGGLASRTVIMPLLFPALVKLKPDGTVLPDLATKWKVSSNGKTWWFWLRRDVKYANGRPFTSADVVSNILHDLDPKTGALVRTYINDVRSVRAITKYEVRFKTGSPRTNLADALYLAKMADLTDATTLATSGNGTGPYKVAGYTPNQVLTLVPNPYYFGPKPCIKVITIMSEPDTTSMVTAFTSKNLDMIWQFPVTATSTIQADQNARIIDPKTVATAHVFLEDTTSAPFDNVLARQALSYATDRNAMVRAAFLGHAQASVANDPLSVTNPAYNKKLVPQKFDLAKAQKLFAQAGVKPGTTFTYWAQAGKRPEWITDGEILQQDLGKIGINLNIVQADPATWLARFDPHGKKYPGLIVASFLSLQPNPLLGLSSALDGCDCNWVNAPGAKYDQYFATVTKALGETSPAKRQALYDQLQVMFSAQQPYQVIAHQTNLVAAQKNVTGAWEDPSGNMHLETARIAN
jgi:peptide/nickel transport system substrate-binding protein